MGHPKPCEISVHPKLTVKKNMFFSNNNLQKHTKSVKTIPPIPSYPIISHHFPSFHINSNHFLSCPIISIHFPEILGIFSPTKYQQKNWAPKHCRTCRGDQYSDIVKPGSVSKVTVSLAIWSAWNCLADGWLMICLDGSWVNHGFLRCFCLKNIDTWWYLEIHHVSIVLFTDSLNYIVFSMCLHLFHKQVE